MTDEALRALEREAATDTTRTLALARALERAGRADEAWVSLCRGVDRPEVRAALVARPAWTHGGGPGGARALDVPPVRTAPRTRWTTTVTDGTRLLASPLGVVVLEGNVDRPTAVLDPRTGQLRWTPDQFTRDAWLHGGLLVAHRRREELVVCRVWADDGELLPGAGQLRLSGAPERLELGLDDAAPRLVARPLEAPADDPADGHIEPQLVGHAGLAAARVRGARVVVVDERAPTKHLLLGQEGQEVWARDLGQPGAEPPVSEPRWTHPGLLLAADGQGVVVRDSTSVHVLDLDGRERWTSPSPGVIALGPRHVVFGPHLAPRRFRPQGASAARIHERVTGRRVIDIPLQDTRVRGCLTRDLLIIPGADDTLAAWTLEGALVWRAPAGGVVRDLAALPGALVALLDDRRVVCLEEGATAP